MKNKMILVCKTNGEKCDEKGYEVKVGDNTHILCCKKGFEKTLDDFLTYESREKIIVYTDSDKPE